MIPRRQTLHFGFEIQDLTKQYRIVGVIANLYPADKRSLYGRRALDDFGRRDIPIAWGEKATTRDRPIRRNQFPCDFMAENIVFTPYGQPKSDPNDPAEIESGISLLVRLVKGIVETPNGQPRTPEPKEKLHFLLVSSIADIWTLAELLPESFIKATARVVIQGEYTVEHNTSDPSYVLKANHKANNNGFDINSADKFHEFICRNNIPSVVVTKVAATASAMPTQVLKDLAATGHKWGKHLYDIHDELSVQYYKDSGDEKTRFQPHMDEKWFLKTRTNWFLTHTEHDPYPKGADVLPYVQVTPYDPLAGLEIAGPDVRDALKIFTPFKDQTIHKIVGKRAPNPVTNDLGDTGINVMQIQTALQALWKGSLLASKGMRDLLV